MDELRFAEIRSNSARVAIDFAIIYEIWVKGNVVTLKYDSGINSQLTLPNKDDADRVYEELRKGWSAYKVSLRTSTPQ